MKASHARTGRGRATKLVADKTPAGRSRQYASDGGAPKPDVGFLGFGGS